jgi:hypothetical protein
MEKQGGRIILPFPLVIAAQERGLHLSVVS